MHDDTSARASGDQGTSNIPKSSAPESPETGPFTNFGSVGHSSTKSVVVGTIGSPTAYER